MAPHSSTLAWKIPWTEEPGRLQSMGSRRVGHDWATSFHFSLSCIGEGNGNPLQCSCLENPRDGGAWWAAVCEVTQSRTRLKWLSISSSHHYPGEGREVSFSWTLSIARKVFLKHKFDLTVLLHVSSWLKQLVPAFISRVIICQETSHISDNNKCCFLKLHVLVNLLLLLEWMFSTVSFLKFN